MSKSMLPKEPSFERFFKNIPDRPSEIGVGQIWSIFKPGDAGEDTMGQLVVVYSCDGEDYGVIPVHSYFNLRTMLDPLIHEDRVVSFDDNYPLVVAVTLLQGFGPEPFVEANFVGSIDDPGMDIINKAVGDFYTALSQLAYVQLKDSYGEELTSKEEDAATKDGIYRFCPVDGKIDDLNKFNERIADIIQPWNMLYVAQSQ